MSVKEKKGTKKAQDREKTKNKMIALNLMIPVIMLNKSSWNTVIKKAEITRVENKA